MNTVVFFIGVIAAVAVLFALPSHGAVPQGPTNIKTSAHQLTSLERLLTRTFKPEIPLNKILAQERSVDGGNTIQDDYDGGLEWWNIEFPLFVLQLNKLGNEVLFPSYTHEYGYYFCFIGVCSGFLQVYSLKKPVFTGVQSAGLSASMNGTQFRAQFQIPDVVGRDPTYTYEDTNYGQDPPTTSEYTIYENATMFIKNFSLAMTANVEMGVNGLEVSNLDIEWIMEDFRIRYENGTHTFADGRQEEWGESEYLIHEMYLEFWYEDEEGDGDTVEKYVEEAIQEWLNCFLSDGRNGGSQCNYWFNEPLHSQSFAELIHAFGLSALNKARAAEQ